jgi:hypothetical protein
MKEVDYLLEEYDAMLKLRDFIPQESKFNCGQIRKLLIS